MDKSYKLSRIKKKKEKRKVKQHKSNEVQGVQFFLFSFEDGNTLVHLRCIKESMLHLVVHCV